MITGRDYTLKVEEFFSFLIKEFIFKLSERKIRGNVFYDMQYKSNDKMISISYENIEDVLTITVFLLENGVLPDYDDKTKTLHLNKLNSSLISLFKNEDITSNNEYFSSMKINSQIEKQLLKKAKELRLCMPYIDKLYK